jgi:hypothetical protein
VKQYAVPGTLYLIGVAGMVALALAASDSTLMGFLAIGLSGVGALWWWIAAAFGRSPLWRHIPMAPAPAVAPALYYIAIMNDPAQDIGAPLVGMYAVWMLGAGVVVIATLLVRMGVSAGRSRADSALV